jgi:hypothetical protein
MLDTRYRYAFNALSSKLTQLRMLAASYLWRSSAFLCKAPDLTPATIMHGQAGISTPYRTCLPA